VSFRASPGRRQPAALALCSLAILALLGGLSASAPAATTDAAPTAPVDELLKLLAARRHSHVTFSEVHELRMLDRPLESSGELMYDAPDRLEKRTLKPKAEDLVLANGVLTARRGQHTRSLVLREHPEAAPFVEAIRATLAGDRAALEQFFRIEFTGSLDRWTLRLVPTDATLARSVNQVRIEGARAAIATVEILETDGDRSRLTLGSEITS